MTKVVNLQYIIYAQCLFVIVFISKIYDTTWYLYYCFAVIFYNYTIALYPNNIDFFENIIGDKTFY